MISAGQVVAKLVTTSLSGMNTPALRPVPGRVMPGLSPEMAGAESAQVSAFLQNNTAFASHVAASADPKMATVLTTTAPADLMKMAGDAPMSALVDRLKAGLPYAGMGLLTAAASDAIVLATGTEGMNLTLYLGARIAGTVCPALTGENKKYQLGNIYAALVFGSFAGIISRIDINQFPAVPTEPNILHIFGVIGLISANVIPGLLFASGSEPDQKYSNFDLFRSGFISAALAGVGFFLGGPVAGIASGLATIGALSVFKYAGATKSLQLKHTAGTRFMDATQDPEVQAEFFAKHPEELVTLLDSTRSTLAAERAEVETHQRQMAAGVAELEAALADADATFAGLEGIARQTAEVELQGKIRGGREKLAAQSALHQELTTTNEKMTGFIAEVEALIRARSELDQTIDRMQRLDLTAKAIEAADRQREEQEARIHTMMTGLGETLQRVLFLHQGQLEVDARYPMLK